MSVQSENKPAYKTTAPSDHSKRVAIPRIKFLDSNAPKLTLSSRDSIIHTNEQPMPSTEVPPHTGHQCPPPSSEDVNREYNVYAAPFIPAQLKEINLELGVIVDSITKHKIDYPTYIKKFAGSSFLPERPTYSPKQQPLLYAPSEVSYLDHISTLWQVEIAALTHQNAQHALYKVPLERRRTQDGEELFLVPIPGLREDNPRIELGDTLQLRSLFRDSRGNIVDIFQQCPLSFGMGYKHRYWTGTIWNASVYGVHRATETVYLKANGLQEVQIGSVWFPLVVNVIFPLNREYTKRCQKALVLIDSALSKAKNFGCVEDNIKEAPHIIEDDALNDNVSSIHLTQTMSPSDQLNSATRNDWIRRILFPAEKDGKLQTILRKIPQRGLYDSLLNYEQAHAVTSICDKNYGTLPYLISGPPGTGKTKSLVEVAMQLLETHTADHILICAPSDQAADTLAMRLKYYLNPTQLLRLNGPWRADNEVTRELMGYTYMENEMFYLPPFRKLMAYNVVVTSCRDASVLMDARLTNTDLWSLEHNMLTAFHPEHKKPPLTLHWGALLVDEAAQATELDVLSAISVVCPPAEYPEELPQPCFVMAGDEHQLGPRTASHDTMLSRSLFARLLDRGALYRDHPLSRSNMKPSSSPPVLKSSMLPIIYPPFANLIRNYRSHPAILSVPSSLFYNDTLIPEAPIPNTPLQHSSLWEGCGWPVLFIPNGGSDEIERDGGGWYNIEEARKACNVAQTLIVQGVKQSDICIMSPFAAQVKVLRKLMRSSAYGGSGYWDVNIGPLEAFQGLEKRAVIICTTRSRNRFVQEDVKHGLGIVHFPRKMNVALTRAMEALVVIGNPAVLKEDPHWREWLAFCSRNGLVQDGAQVIEDGHPDGFGNMKIGVLERALLAKEEKESSRGESRKVLGGSAVVLEQDVGGEYEAWLEGLREALEDEEEREVENEEETEEDVEHPDGHDLDDEHVEESLDITS